MPSNDETFYATSAVERVPSNTPEEITVGDLLKAAWTQRYWAAISWIFVTGTVFIALLRQTPMYEAEATLFFNRERQATVVGPNTGAGDIELGFLNAEKDRLLSTPLLRDVLVTMQLTNREPYASSTNPAGVLAKRVQVSTGRDVWTMTVSAEDENPDTATKILTAVLEAYERRRAVAMNARAQYSLGWLSQEVTAARTRLQQARIDEQSFRREYDILSTDPDQNHHAQRLRELELMQINLEGELAAAGALANAIALAAIENNPDALLRIQVINRHPVVIEQQQLLYKLQDERVLLSQKYKSAHPRYLEIEQQIAAKENHLNEAIALARASVETEQQKLQQQAKELEALILAERKILTDYRQKLVQLMALEQEVTAQQSMVERLLTAQTEQDVATRLSDNQVEILQPPEAGQKPVNIRKTLFAAASLFLGGLAATAVVAALQLTATRITGIEQALNDTELHPLSVLPESEHLDDREAGLHFSGQIRESLNTLRTALYLSIGTNRKGYVVEVTSAAMADGKSTVASGLAIACALAGRKVLIVDADLRRPSLHRKFNQSVSQGTSVLLAGGEVQIQEDIIENLDFLGVGTVPPNPAELLSSKKLEQAIADWREIYDLIVIDSPPLALVSDGMLIADQADGVILVVRDRETKKRELKKAMASVNTMRHKMLGLVYNGDRGKGMAYNYAYHYGSGQHESAVTEFHLPAPKVKM
jgi:capsular exopolysaccharide synthesis family protein